MRIRRLQVPVICALLTAIITAPAHAQPAPPDTAWTSGGVAVAPLDSAGQLLPEIASDGAGGAYIVWPDERFGHASMFAQHLTSRGTTWPLWPTSGVWLAGANSGWDPFLIADGSDGALVTWMHVGEVAYCSLIPGGLAPPAAYPGMASPLSPDKFNDPRVPFVRPDGAGGRYIGWELDDIRGNKVVVERLNADGSTAAGWPAGGIRPENTYSEDFGPVMCADDSGGVILAWTFILSRTGAAAARITGDGTPVPGWPSAPDIGVDTTNSPHFGLGIVPDGSNGALIVWEDGRNGAWDQLYAQHLTANGAIAPGWPAGGMRVCSYPSAASITRQAAILNTYSAFAGDGAGGAYVTWSDARSDSGDIYIQHLRPDVGIAPGWPEDGLALCSAPGSQLHPVLIADGTGGTFVTWEDARGGASNVYVQHVDGSGAVVPGWPAGGLAPRVQTEEQLHPRLTTDGAFGAILAWEDKRGAWPQIYAAHLTHDGVVATEISLASAEALPGLARLAWYGDGLRYQGAVLERREATASWTDWADLAPSGTGRIEYEDRRVESAHRYGYRLRIAGAGGPEYFGEAWVEIPGGPAVSLEGPTANPSRGAMDVRFSLESGAPARLDVLDITGRRVESREVGALGAGRHSLRVGEGHRLAPGIYVLRLTQGGRALSVRGCVLE